MSIDWSKPIENHNGSPARDLAPLSGGRRAVIVTTDGHDTLAEVQPSGTMGDFGFIRNVPEKPKTYWIGQMKARSGEIWFTAPNTEKNSELERYPTFIRWHEWTPETGE